MKIKLFFSLFLSLLCFTILSILVSIKFIDLPEDSDSLEVGDNMDKMYPQEEFLFDRFIQKIQRVRRLDLRKLQRSHSCRFYCQPAVENHNSGVGSNLANQNPVVRIMINHCLRCLRRKGYMERIMQRRFLEKTIFATPRSEITSPISKNAKYSAIIKPLEHHAVFGGWISDSWNKINKRSSNEISSNKHGSRMLLAEKEASDLVSLDLTEGPIVLGDRMDDDYINNYEDSANGDLLPDFDKVEQETKDLIAKIIFGSFVFCGVLFIVIFPFINFMNMCTDNFGSNLRIAGYVLSCRDPKYILVKETCEERNIFIPEYKIYRRLMKKYQNMSERNDKRTYDEKNAFGQEVSITVSNPEMPTTVSGTKSSTKIASSKIGSTIVSPIPSGTLVSSATPSMTANPLTTSMIASPSTPSTIANPTIPKRIASQETSPTLRRLEIPVRSTSSETSVEAESSESFSGVSI